MNFRVLPFAFLFLALLSIGCRSIISHEIRNSREYILGIDTFRSSPKARELLGDHPDVAEGDPHESGHTLGDNGSEVLNVPVSGSLRKGMLYFKAMETSGQWHIDEMALRLKNQSNWDDLLPDVTSKPAK